MALTSILALTDFSTAAEHALERAALVALRHQAGLRVMYGAEQAHPAFLDPYARVQQRARQLGRRYGLDVKAVAHGGHLVKDVVKQSRHADLLVLDARRHRNFLAFWRGTALDQLLRRCPCPVLVVKQPPLRRYERTLVAVDFTPPSKQLVRYACGFEVEASVDLFHAFDTGHEPGLRMAGGSAELVKAYRQAAFQHAQDRLLRLSSSLDTRRNRVSSVAGRGDPAQQIAVQQDATGADLVVVGRKRRSAVGDFLFGDVTRRLIALAGSDVLVVSGDYPARSVAAAKARTQPVLNEGASRWQVVRKRAL